MLLYELGCWVGCMGFIQKLLCMYPQYVIFKTLAYQAETKCTDFMQILILSCLSLYEKLIF